MKKISYDQDIVTDNAPVQSKKCNGIIFRNIGDVDAVIGDIPLPAGAINDDYAHMNPNEYLENTFALKFDTSSSGTNKKVAVIRKYAVDIAVNEQCHYKK